MIIGIWVLIITCTVIILGEIRYHYLDKKEKVVRNREISKDWKDNIDADIDELSMEYVSEEFVSSQSLAMRGSRRLAQNQVIGIRTFNRMRTEEYDRML